MAYVVIPSSQTDPGQPIKAELMDTIRLNLDDHEARIQDVEASSAAGQVLVYEVYDLWYQRSFTKLTGVSYWIFRSNYKINGAFLIKYEDGISGTLEADLLVSTNFGGSFSSIYSTRPSITQAAPSFTPSSNQILTSTPFLVSTNDILRLDITSKLFGCKQFQLVIDLEVDA